MRNSLGQTSSQRMRIVHVSTSDLAGGAARAAYRLHRGLQARDVDSYLVVQAKQSTSSTVYGPQTKLRKGISVFRPTLDRLPQYAFTRTKDIQFSYAWMPTCLPARVDELKPDIVNLHWIGKGFVRIGSLSRLGAHIVWTLHDMWAVTGGCHIVGDCERYEEQCGACPQLASNRNRDLSRWVWRRKSRAWKDLTLTLVAPSHWLGEKVSASSLAQDREVHVIHHGIDTAVFKPQDKEFARSVLGLPQSRKIILFGAVHASSDQNKGFHHLHRAVRRLATRLDPNDLYCAVFGTEEPSDSPDMGMTTNYLGHFNDELMLSLVYSAADVMVVPSIQEAFGQTAAEALACGVPVVSFDTSGLKDIVEHKRCGYRATCFDEDDLAAGIVWVLEDETRRHSLSQSARLRVEQLFSRERQAERYIELYARLLS